MLWANQSHFPSPLFILFINCHAQGPKNNKRREKKGREGERKKEEKKKGRKEEKRSKEPVIRVAVWERGLIGSGNHSNIP